MEDDQSIKVFNLRLINQVRIQTPCAPPVTFTQYNMAIHDFNRVILNVSIRLSQYLIVYRLIGNIRVSMTKTYRQKLQIKGTT